MIVIKLDADGWRKEGKPFGEVQEGNTCGNKRGCSVIPYLLPHDPDLSHDVEPTKRQNPLQKAA